jgi:hypothetical protein
MKLRVLPQATDALLIAVSVGGVLTVTVTEAQAVLPQSPSALT